MNKEQFEWQAEQDQDLTGLTDAEQNGRAHRRLWLIIAVFLFIGVASLITVRFFSQRQLRLEEEIRSDLLASFDLWHKAVKRGDDELYAHLLSTDDRSWQQQQKQLFAKDLILDRSYFSLTSQDGLQVEPQLSLAPDYQRATITFVQEYAVAPGFMEQVRLQHTAVFANQDSNWLQIAPDEDFWGEYALLESDDLILRYPTRDEAVALQIGRRLAADLHEICAPASDQCAHFKPITLEMSTAQESLAALETAAGPLLSGSTFQLPAPTIVGLPLDESSFQAFYQGYTRSLLEHLRIVIDSPAGMPEQVIRALCFNHPNVGPKLYRYDPAFGSWTPELPERSFRFLESLPRGQGLFLDEITFDQDAWGTRFIHLRDGSETLLLDDITGLGPYQVLDPGDEVGRYLVLRRATNDQSAYFYSSLDLGSCDQFGCAQADLPGIALWSSDGEQTIVLVDSEIYLGDEEGQIEAKLDEGFNPFWLDVKNLAYVRFAQRETGTTTEMVMHTPASGAESLLFDSDDLSLSAAVEEGEMFIRYIIPNPADPDQLLVSAAGVRQHAGDYFIFVVALPDPGQQVTAADIALHVHRSGATGVELGQLSSAGYPPFLPSPDGRWLLITELSGYDSARRTFLLHDLQNNETRIISEGDPVYPAQFPSFDWSDDGRWLVIAGDGFLRLIAPEDAYEKLVPHNFDYCTLTRWSD